MDITLRYPSGVAFIFPVNPEEITIRRDKQFETVNILSLGEVDVPQKEKVREISFSSFFPKHYDGNYCIYEYLPDPQSAMNQLTALMNDKQPVQLIISHTAVNVLVTLSSHQSTFRGGEPGDVYFDVTFRTYREMKVKPVGGSNDASTRTDQKPVPKMYTVKTGDTLSGIAKLQFGSSAKWKSIYEKNRKTIGPDPNVIRPGQKLVMP